MSRSSKSPWNIGSMSKWLSSMGADNAELLAFQEIYEWGQRGDKVCDFPADNQKPSLIIYVPLPTGRVSRGASDRVQIICVQGRTLKFYTNHLGGKHKEKFPHAAEVATELYQRLSDEFRWYDVFVRPEPYVPLQKIANPSATQQFLQILESTIERIREAM